MRGKLLGSLESRVMEFFWQSGCQASIPDLYKFLIKKDKLAYTTVATVVSRLVTKGLLTRDKVDSEFIYKCQQTKQEFLAKKSRGLAKLLLGNFGELAIASFVEEVKANPKALRKLQELSDER